MFSVTLNAENGENTSNQSASFSCNEYDVSLLYKWNAIGWCRMTDTVYRAKLTILRQQRLHRLQKHHNNAQDNLSSVDSTGLSYPDCEVLLRTMVRTSFESLA